MPSIAGTPNKSSYMGFGAFTVEIDGAIALDSVNNTLIVQSDGMPQPVADTTNYPVRMAGPGYAPALTVFGSPSSHFGQLAVGPGRFDGTGSTGAFLGNVNGTGIAGNFSGSGDLINLGTNDGLNFTSKFSLDASGNIILAGSITLGTATLSTTVGPAGTAAALPALPVKYLTLTIEGVAYKIPLYNV